MTVKSNASPVKKIISRCWMWIGEHRNIKLEKAHHRCLIRIQFGHHGAGSDAIRVVEEAYVTLPDPARQDRCLLKAKGRWHGRFYPSNREEDYSVSRKIKKRINA
jgi:hypothetical protein